MLGMISTIIKEALMIKGIKFASIPVRDQKTALAFYTEKLGFEILTDQPFDDNQRWIELSVAGAPTRLVLFTPPGHEGRIGSFSNVTFYSDNVQHTYEQLSARGVEFTQEPQTADWGVSAMFKDPDGNMFLISSK